MGAIQQALLAYGAAAGAGPTYSDPWEPLFSAGTHLTFSASNSVVTLGSDNAQIARSLVSKVGGKWYFEVVATELGAAATNYGVGIAGWDQALANVLGGASSIGTRNTDVYLGSADVGDAWASLADGDVCGVAVDFDSALIWFRNSTAGPNWNNSGTADPSTATGGISFSAIQTNGKGWFAAWSGDRTTQAATLRTTAANFTDSPPSGFLAWDNGGVDCRGVNKGNGAAALPVLWKPGDLFVLMIETANETISTPSGWTEFASSPQGTGTAAGASSSRLTAFYRLAQSGDTAPTISGHTNHAFTICAGFGHVDQTTPIDATPAGTTEASSTTSVTFPEVTTATDLACVLVGVTSMVDTSVTQVSTITFASLDNIIGPYQLQLTAGNGGGVYLFMGDKTTAGATGTGTATLATTSVQGRMTIPIRPA